MKNMRSNIDLRRISAFLAALLMWASLCAPSVSIIAAPNDTSYSDDIDDIDDSDIDEDDDEDEDEPERGTIRGTNSSSSTTRKSKKSSSDDEDEDEDDEDKPTPSPTPDPRVGKDGKPKLNENEAAVLINTTNGEIMFEQNPDKRVYPASTTKIMTALLTLEAIDRGEINLQSAFLIMPEMLVNLPSDGSSMKLKEGESMTVQHLLEGLLVESGNDAAQALAIIVCGDIPTFVQRMNDKAAELGLGDTNFVNTHGLHDENHYTTARDLARLTLEAMKNNTFREIVAMDQAVIPATAKTGTRTFVNTNGLLSYLKYTNYFYSYAIGVKTGHTSQAGYCLISAAQKGDLEVVGVLMNGRDEDDRHLDSRNMLKYALDNFKTVTAVSKGDMVSEIKVRFGSGSDYTTLSTDSDIKVTIPVDTNADELTFEPQIADYLVAPVNQGDEVGTVDVMLNVQVVGSGTLVADIGVKRHPLGFLMQFFSFIWSFMIVRILLIIIAAGALIFLIYMFLKIRKNIKIAERRRRMSRNRNPRSGRRR